MTSERVDVVVDALELEGLDVEEPLRVRSAFQRELGRLVTERGLPARVAASPRRASLEGGALAARDLTSPERLGRAVAHLVYAELCK